MMSIGKFFYAFGRPIIRTVVGIAFGFVVTPTFAANWNHKAEQPQQWPKFHISEDLTTSSAFPTLSYPDAADQIGSNVKRFPGQQVGKLGAPERLKVIGSAAFSHNAIKTALFSNIDFLASGHRLASLDDYIRAIQEAIELGYASSGFPDADVTVNLDVDTSSLVAKIDEGIGYIAGPVEIIGATRVPATNIIARLTDYFPPRRETRPAIDPELSNGFSIGRSLVQDANGKFVIEEEPVWLVNERASFAEQTLIHVKERVRLIYADNGYFLTEPIAEILTDAANGTARLVVKIANEGPLSVIDKIEIVGNDRDRDSEILHFLDVALGDKLTRADLHQFEHRLLESARFSQVVVERVITDAQALKIALHIEVVEWPEAPPLSANFSSAEKFFLDIGNWMARSLATGSDFVFTFDGLMGAVAGRIVISRAGALVELLDNTSNSAEPILTGTLQESELGLYSHWRKRKVVQSPIPGASATVNVSLSPINRIDATERSEIGFSAYLGTRSVEEQEIIKVNALFSPAVFLLIAHQAEWIVSEEAGVKTAVSEHLKIRIDATTGAVLEISGEKSNRGIAALFDRRGNGNIERLNFGIAVVNGAFKRELEKLSVTAGSYLNLIDGEVPWSSWIAFFSQEMVAAADYVAAVLGNKDLLTIRRNGPDLSSRLRAADIASRVITPMSLHPLESSLAGVFSDPSEPRFVASHQNIDAVTQSILGLSGLGIAINDALLPRESWAWTLIRESIFIFNGKGAYFDREMSQIGNVQRAGPTTFLAIAKLFEAVGIPASVQAAAFGLEKNVIAFPDRDYKFLLRDKSAVNESLNNLVASISTLNVQELDALAVTMPADVAKALRIGADVSRASDSGTSLENFLPMFWHNYVAGLVQSKLEDSFSGDHIVAPGAQYAIGRNFLQGSGAPQSDYEAWIWFLRAAEQNHAASQTEIAKLHAQGRAGPQDYIEAYKWLDIAARNGHVEAIALRNTLAGIISEQEIMDAQKRASEWMTTLP